MILLSAFGPLWGVPDPSPFVIKTMVQLKMAGVAYETARFIPSDGPKGKLPFIEDGGQRIGDSTFIRDHLERTYGADLDAGLSPRQKALAWMAERVVEDHLYWATVYFRWADREHFDKGPAVFFAGAPDAIVEAGREAVMRTLDGQGFGRHAPHEVADLGARSAAALAELLGDGPYLCGQRRCGADATLFGGVAAALAPHFDTPLRKAVEAHPNLVAYRDRMMAEFFPAAAPAEPVPA